ncbi:hypothetical protein H1R20_g1144, partial [Candolleomyces eurysporus]
MSSVKRTKKGKLAEGQSPQLTVSEHLEDAAALNRTPKEWGELWDCFDRYYIENEKVIMEAAQLDMTELGQASSKKASRYEDAMTSFLENSKTIVHGLQFLSEIHPAISGMSSRYLHTCQKFGSNGELAVAVGAFAAVIKLELIRRDNNAKAMGVKLQMQNLMCTLYQVRNLRTEQHDSITSVRLASMMSIIAKEIKACGNDLSYYQDKKLIHRLIHAQFFEQRLTSHITTFAERRSELELLIASYTAGRVHETAETVSRVEFKVDDLLSFLHRLESAREKEAIRFIESNGGIKHCISHNGLLEELLIKTGESIKDIKEIKTQLKKELTENVEELLKKNMTNFEGMLRIQKNNIQHMAHLMENQTSQIMKISNEIAMMFPGMRKHVLLTDPVDPAKDLDGNGSLLMPVFASSSRVTHLYLQGLRQSVKAKKFVLTFKDYHIRMNPPKSSTILATPSIHIVELPPSTDLESSLLKPVEADTLLLGANLEREATDDEWALEYIDVVHLDPIVEAIDDDFSGFISIHEANRFAVARPKGWSLLRWFAYWAAGWAISVKRYRDQIYGLVQKIFEARLDVLPCNRAIFSDYLDSSAFTFLDSLLRSTQPHVGEYDSTDPKLAELISNLDEQQEERLLSNLKDLKYNIPSVDNVTLVTGPGRVERFAFPLIYLLLKHHLHVIRLSSQYRLCSAEMLAHSFSLLNVLISLRQRAEKLEAIFRQKSRSIRDQFLKFSFGMFERFNSTEPYEIKNNSMLAYYHESFQSHVHESNADNTESSPDSESKSKASSSKFILTEPDLEALNYLVQDRDHEDDRPEWDADQHIILNDFSSPVGGSRTLNTIAGGWTGRMYEDLKSVNLNLLRFDLPRDHTATEFEGIFEAWMGSGKVKGTIERRKPITRIEGAEDVGGDNEAGVGFGDGDGDGGDERPIVALEFTADVSAGSKYHFRVTPVGDHSLDWKGEWKYLDHESDTVARPFELLRLPPEGARFRSILEDALVEDEPLAEPNQSGMERVAEPLEHLESLDASVQATANDEFNSTSRSSTMERSRKVALARWRSYFEQMADERRRWITAYMKVVHEENTIAHTREFFTLCASVHPNISAVWCATSDFYLLRRVGESITSYVTCDSCANQFCFLRHICIVCCSKSLDSEVDICERCIDKKEIITNNNFTHQISHTMLRTYRHIPWMEFAQIIPQARIRSSRVKAGFHSGGSHHHGAPSKPQEHRFEDVFICMDCESNKRQQRKHDASHCLLRIYDSVDMEGQGSGDQAEKYIKETKSMLNQGMDALKTSLDDKMNALMEHVEKIHQAIFKDRSDSTLSLVESHSPNDETNHEAQEVAAVSRRLEYLESQVNSRLESLESILQRILDAAGASR